MKKVDEFLNSNDLLSGKFSFIFVTDGPWDFKDFLIPECRNKNIEIKEYYNNWVNIRKLFGKFYKTKPVGIKKMVLKLSLEFVGIAHQGIDDSRNIANVGIQMIKDGCILNRNASMDEFKKK